MSESFELEVDKQSKLVLKRSGEDDALDIALNEMVIVMLLEDRGPRVAEDPVPLLVGERA